MIFKGCNESKQLSERSHFFKMLNGKKISVMLPRSSKLSFQNGIIIPTKMRQCYEGNDKILCMTCNNQVNENKEFEANLYLLKRQAPNDFGYKFSYSKD